MFESACALAHQFTRPVIMSHRMFDGSCRAGIASFVVVNQDGWCLTALHVITEIRRLKEAAESFRNLDDKRAKINGDASLEKRERGAQLRALGKPSHTDVTNSSTWWGADHLRVDDVYGLPAADIAAFRLQNFNPASIKQYPVFKNPAAGMRPGRSLCRVGFPFHQVKPEYDQVRGAFVLPAGTLPVPFFSNDGIMAREVEIAPPPGSPPLKFRIAFVETSNPGLKGQSGGPLFDAHGNIWGIQSSTRHYPLGFSPDVPSGRPGEKEHQFLNAGWATHSETLIGFLQDHGIAFSTSNN